MRFLVENNAVINMKENFIVIDGLEYELNIKNNNACEEEEIYDKSKLIKPIDNRELKLLIKEAKQNNNTMGEVSIVSHEISLMKEFNLIPREYPVPLKLRENVEAHLNKLISDGIIEEKFSSCISPAFVIIKKNGKIRLVVDYRYLNSITKKTHQFTPKINEILATLHGSKIFSKIDLNQGYYQIKMKPEDIYKTGFRLLNRTFVFNRMPFGLCNAPSTFQRTMNHILKDIKNVHVYLDDILIYTPTLNEHIVILREVFKRIKENNMSINFEKSKFGLEEIDFLGHIINSEGIRPDVSNIKKVQIPDKITRKKLERLLGLINWFRPYIRNLSNDLSPFYKKLKSKNIEWNQKDKEEMSNIFNKINKQPLLSFPDLNKHFELF
ncbi:Retrovirus-related Pol polyprotein from transposon 17.6, partial [Dictyocoela muelleri]